MPNFEAYWVPSPESYIEDYYPPDVAVAWLREQKRPRVVVVPGLGQSDYIGDLPSDVEVTTPRSRNRRHVSTEAAVLVLFPGAETLELADSLGPRSVCVADNGNRAVRAWAAQHEAQGLVPAGWDGELPELPTLDLPEDVQEELRFVIDFDGHNQFTGAGGKRYAVEALRRIDAAHPDLPAEDVETWLLSQPEVTARGAGRLVKLLNEIRSGVRHRDYDGRTI